MDSTPAPTLRYFPLFAFLLSGLLAQAQGNTDLFNLRNSKTFADYLIISRQYELAAIEYERICFMAPQNDTFQLNLLRSYRLSGKPQMAIQRFAHHPFSLQSANQVRKEYCKSLIVSRQHQPLNQFLAVSPPLDRQESLWFGIGNRFLQGEKKLLTDGLPVEMALIIQDAQAFRPKKPWLAASMSTVVPGLGKVYAGRWRDGLFSAFIVGTTCWRSYRFFEKKGIKSVPGWIFGSIGAGFYLGNIWGSHRAAKMFNFQNRKGYEDRMENYILGL